MAGAAVFGKILQMVGGTLGAAGQMRNDVARATQLRFESQMDLRNVQLIEQDIGITKEAGAVQRANISKQEQLSRGEARVAFASGNVAVDEGSALDYDIALAEQAAMDRATTKDAERLAVHRLKTEREGLLASAKMKRKAASSQTRNAQLGFAGNMLSVIGGGVGGMGGK